MKGNLLFKKYTNSNFKVFSKCFTTIDPFGGRFLSDPPVNPIRLKNKVALITGATGGVGSATAELFGKSGISGMMLTDLNEELGRKLCEKLNAERKNNFCTFQKADLSNKEEIQELFKMMKNNYGQMDILFNNAGIMHKDDDDPVSTSEDVYDITMNINVRSIFLSLKYGIPLMLKTGGSIINTSSIVALMGSAAAQIAYTASKGAVLSMTKEVSAIYAKQNIRCNAICPGPLRTELLMKFLNTEEKLKRRIVHLPMGRFGESKEIANAAAFLASDESSFINGTTFVVDGGLTTTYVTAE